MYIRTPKSPLQGTSGTGNVVLPGLLELLKSVAYDNFAFGKVPLIRDCPVLCKKKHPDESGWKLLAQPFYGSAQAALMDFGEIPCLLTMRGIPAHV